MKRSPFALRMARQLAVGLMVRLRLVASTVVQLTPLLPARLYCRVLCRSTIAELPGKNRRVSRVGEYGPLPAAAMMVAPLAGLFAFHCNRTP